MAKLSESGFWTISSLVGLFIIVMQVLPIFSNNWVLVVEPRTSSVKNNKGENVDAYYEYKVGLFSACRKIKQPINITELDISEKALSTLLEVASKESGCVWNPSYTGDDLSVRLTVPMILHVIGSALSVLAWTFSLYGFLKKDSKALYSAILYVLGGLGIVIGILQLICVVDDEMYPRMKRDPAGEESKYSFNYGICWISSAFSFLPVQLCVYLQITIFFNRFATPQEKTRIVPGIGELLNQLTNSIVIRSRIHQLGRPAPIGGWSRGDGVKVNFAERSRRESRVSKDFSFFNDFAVPQSSLQHTAASSDTDRSDWAVAGENQLQLNTSV